MLRDGKISAIAGSKAKIRVSDKNKCAKNWKMRAANAVLPQMRSCGPAAATAVIFLLRFIFRLKFRFI